MAAIHEHGMIWKDTYPGVWTALGEVLGKPVVFYAAEVKMVDDDQVAETEQGARIVKGVRELADQPSTPLGTIRLGDADCVLSVLLD